MNVFLKGLPHDTRLMLYGIFGDCMHAVMLIMLFIMIKRAKLDIKSALKLFFSYYAAFFAGTTACNVLGKLTNGLIPKINLGVSFFIFLLVLCLLLRLLKAPVLKSLDIAVPIFILGRGIGIIGCLFPGCCHGFPAAWGIYSNSVGTTVVPTVLFDIFLSYAIVLYLLLTRRKHSVSGILAAKGILLFGVLRYVIDVLRDNNKLFLMVTVEGICGIVYVLVGLILLYAIDKSKSPKPT